MIELEELDQKLSGVSTAIASAQAYDPQPGQLLMNQEGSRIRLSYSTLELLHGCERKFQKVKLLHNPRAREESPAMSFGNSIGQAWQLYFILRTYGHSVQQSLDSAIWETFISYWPALEDDRRYVERAIKVMIESIGFLEQQLKEWDIAFFNGKPASELGFRLEIDSKFYFVGAIDLVLKHKISGRYGVVDVKTTSMRGEDLTPNYKFSDQTLGYTIVIDAIAGEEVTQYDTIYWVCQLPNGGLDRMYSPIFHSYRFPKTIRDRFDWFLKVYLDVNYMRTLEQLNSYPKRGSNCMAYNKVCPFFNECQFTHDDLPAIYVPDDKVYEFTYQLDEILEDHNRRLAAA